MVIQRRYLVQHLYAEPHACGTDDPMAEDKRNPILPVRVAPSDRELLERAAASKGLALSAFVRMAALDSARRILAEHVELEARRDAHATAAPATEPRKPKPRGSK